MKLKKTFWVESKQWDALSKISDKTGAPVAELIRRAIDAFLKKARETRNAA
jgi:ribbon-helix-helix protein